MTTNYYGAQSPGSLWYAWQYAKAFATTPFRAATRPDVWATGKNTTFSIAALIGTKAVVPYVALLPIVPAVLWIGGIGAGIYFGKQAYDAVGALKRSGTVRDFISQRKEKWTIKKAGPKLGARIKAWLARVGAIGGYGLVAAGAVIGSVAALQLTGVISVALISTLSTIVALPVVIGLAVAALPLGIATGIICKNKADKLLGIAAPEKKPALSKAPANAGALESVTAAFDDTARKGVVASEAQDKNAAIRAAARKGNKPESP